MLVFGEACHNLPRRHFSSFFFTFVAEDEGPVSAYDVRLANVRVLA
jgi:hypothetical protein